MKIAVATSDQINADHFGRAKGFAIYQWDGNDPEFIKYIKTNIDPEEKHQWQKGLSLLEDCEIIIAAQAGMKAKYGIKKANLKLVEEEGTVEEVLKRFIDHERFMSKPI
ncbi:MAG: NifB/NifX family molybdenum-iron cluster-binding protein [Euryarchaeota archaeon]|jgi:predicted Fe-Mo cluster-binding NifX family protein|uniref:NifB/NifX family molybdenum-iron cluster-binding protein n=1 Tax=Methanobacterium sp. MZD130B TaxID=3394378 RepID=UPI001761ECE1|nr:NifB/NifX family molybdenum-iron cluster-binding protein [Euryarchaeota archaeon]HHT19392.1 dinitrogenase iron-molybdenum cofactor biosynthesis protein [Methanobacterium sp.]